MNHQIRKNFLGIFIKNTKEIVSFRGKNGSRSDIVKKD